MKIDNLIQTINSFISTPYFHIAFLILKIIFIIAFFCLLGGIIYFLLKTDFLKVYILEDLIEFLSFKPYGMAKSQKRWSKIRERLRSNDEDDFKVAVIEANLFLNELLKEKGCEGIDVKEKLERLGEDVISNFDDFLEVYKTYKFVSEDPSYHLTKKEAERFLDVYEAIMKDLGFLP